MERSEQLAALAEFDKRNRQYNSYSLLSYKVVGVIFGFIEAIFAMLPIGEWGSSHVYIQILFYYCMMHMMYYGAFAEVRDGKKPFSIFEVLKYAPIEPRVICLDRAKRFSLFAGKVMAAFLSLQILSSLLFTHTVGIWNVLVPLAYGAVSYAVMMLMLFCSMILAVGVQRKTSK